MDTKPQTDRRSVPVGVVTSGRRPAVIFALLCLAGSLACVAIAPFLMPDSYSWVEHSVSESAGQGVDHAWVARLGFLLLGFGVLLIAVMSGERWGGWGRLAHQVYGVSIIAAAAFAHMPFENVPYDRFEDFLHSVAAFGVGFGFTAGVLLVTFRRGSGARFTRAFDWSAILAAFAVPMMMFNVTGVAGLVQRVMFLIGYLWYAMEAVRSAGARERSLVAGPTPRASGGGTSQPPPPISR